MDPLALASVDAALPRAIELLPLAVDPLPKAISALALFPVADPLPIARLRVPLA